MTDSWERDFAAYVDGRGSALRSTAYLLCGNWHTAEDLTQAALTKLYLAWRRMDHVRQCRRVRAAGAAADLPRRAAPAVAAGAVIRGAARPAGAA